MRKMTINKNAIIHYVGLYLLLLLQGSVYSRQYENEICILALIYALTLLCFNANCSIKRVSNLKHYYVWIAGCFLLMGISAILNDGSLSIFSIGNVVVRLLIAVTVVLYEPSRVCERFVKICTFLAGVSVIGFFFQAFMPEILPLFGSDFQGQYIVNPFFAWGYRMHPYRNIGIYAEPGLYSIVLLVSLYFLVHQPGLCGSIETKKRKYILCIILAIITTQSTTCYLGTIICLFFWFVKKSRGGQTKWRKLLIVTVAVGILCFDLQRGADSLINQVIIMKITGQNGGIDLSVSTGKSRIVSMLADLEVAKRYPFGAGFTIYEQSWNGFLSQWIPDQSSCMGITKALATYGVPVCVCYYIFLLHQGRYNQVCLLDYILIIILFVISTSAEPQIFYPGLMMLFLIRRESSTKRNENNV